MNNDKIKELQQLANKFKDNYDIANKNTLELINQTNELDIKIEELEKELKDTPELIEKIKIRKNKIKNY